MEDIIFKSGISEKQIEELIKYSGTDDLIMKNTNDSKRFKDRESFKKWMEIPREIYVLTNENDDLLGIVWFRTQDLKGSEQFGLTFAIRIYGNARGKGLSYDFLKKAFDKFKKTKLYSQNKNKKFWLETRADNSAAIKLYEKFNFKTVSKPNENGRIFMSQS